MAELNRNRNILVSWDSKEAAYGTAAAVDSLLKVDVENIPNPNHTIINDSDQLGASEEPSAQEIIAKANSMTISQKRAKYHTLAGILVYGLGDVASALADTGTPASGAYKHVITPRESDVMDSFTAEALFKTGVQRKYPGCGVKSWMVRVERGANRIVSVSADILMSGAAVTGTGDVAEKAEAAINAGNSGVWMDEEAYSGSTDDDCDPTSTDLDGTPDSIVGKVRSLEWSGDNRPDEDDLYRLNSGLNYGAFERGERIQKVNLNFDYADESEIDRYEAQTQVALQWKIRGAEIETGYYYGVNLIFPLLQIESIQRAVDKGKLVNQITYQVLQDATFGSVVVDVFNEQAAYAA